MGLKLIQEQLDCTPENEEKLTTLRAMQDACHTSGTILDELLTYEELESGSLKLDTKQLQIMCYLKSTVLSFELLVMTRFLGIVLHMTRSDPIYYD